LLMSEGHEPIAQDQHQLVRVLVRSMPMARWLLMQ